MDKPAKNGRQNYPWSKIKAEYVADPESSVRKIAKKFGVSVNTMSKRCTDEGWYKDKVKYQQMLYEKAAEKVVSDRADILAQDIESVINMSNRIKRVLNEDEVQFNRHLVQITTSSIEDGTLTTTEERVYDKLDTRAMKDVMACVKLVEELKRSMLEYQRLGERQKHEIELQRLELERERLEFERQKAEMNKPDASAVILIEGYQQGWEE